MSYSDNKITGICFPGIVDSSEYPWIDYFRYSHIKSEKYTSTLNKMVRDYF